MKYDVIVVGGGASGFLAAIEAAKRGLQTAIIEKKKEPLRKVLVSGNGRCNFTNLTLHENCYHSENSNLVYQFAKEHSGIHLMNYFQELGMRIWEKDGYCYPYTNQGKTVVTLLKETAVQYGVHLILDRIVRSIKKEKEGFHIITSYKEFDADYVVLATGGKAGIGKNEEAEGYDLARAFSHHITPLISGLTKVFCGGNYSKEWKGIRQKAKVYIEVDGVCQFEDYGEIQFNEDNVSGIPILQVSRFAAKAIHEKKEAILVFDFFAPLTKEAFIMQWENVKEQRISLRTFFKYQFVERFIDGCQYCFTDDFLDTPLNQLTKEECDMVYQTFSQMRFPVMKAGDFGQSQVTAGGVDISEVNLNTMESKKCQGLYLTGELLDVDGICGGYNLTWAFETGIVAGKNIGKGRNNAR